MPTQGRLPLTRNFRSQPAILHFVNALFDTVLGPGYEPLVPDREQVGPQPAIEFLWAPAMEGEDDDARQSVSALRQREADWIAPAAARSSTARSRSSTRSEAMVVSDGRPVAPGDIAILFRALSDLQYYEAALRRYQLEYYVVGGHAFYAQQEVFDVLNLLRTLASPADEVSLAGVLRSPIFSLADETLFWLSRHPDGLAAGLLQERLPQELDDDQRRRATFAAATITELRALQRSTADHRPARCGTRTYRLRCRAAGRISRRAQAGQSEKAARSGSGLRSCRDLHAGGLYRPTGRVRGPPAGRGPGRYACRARQCGAINVDPPVEGAGVSASSWCPT